MPNTPDLEPMNAKSGFNDSKTLRSIAISLKRIADMLEKGKINGSVSN